MNRNGKEEGKMKNEELKSDATGEANSFILPSAFCLLPLIFYVLFDV
jgi:hypothetical protein